MSDRLDVVIDIKSSFPNTNQTFYPNMNNKLYCLQYLVPVTLNIEFSSL